MGNLGARLVLSPIFLPSHTIAHLDKFDKINDGLVMSVSELSLASEAGSDSEGQTVND